MRFNRLITSTLLILFIAFLLYSRFIGLDWGLPYPMHPDERNMVISILQLKCDSSEFSECFNPHFFAYGQLPLYAGFLLSVILQNFQPDSSPLAFETVALSLRILSAIGSIIMVLFLYKTISYFYTISTRQVPFVISLLTFVPSFILFSHYGTTESLLMMFISVIVYYSVKLIEGHIELKKYVRIVGILLGLAVGTKVSAVLFACIPFFAICIWYFQNRSLADFGRSWFSLIKIASIAIIFFIISSPYNIIDWEGFIHSMNYESAIGIGTYKAFYTRQFEYTIPFIFQVLHVFPYALGWPIFIFSILGFLFLPWSKKYNLLRLTLIIVFVPHVIMYAKWTRFIAHVFPLMVLFSIFFILRVINLGKYLTKTSDKAVSQIMLFIIWLIVIVPGIAYLAIYQNPDVRFRSSKWIYENVPTGTYILSETANVVDIPMVNELVIPEIAYARNLHPISFNFYELDNDELESELKEHLARAEYIFVPSRRIFWNHTCYRPDFEGKIVKKEYSAYDGYTDDRCQSLANQYPLLNDYYDGLFLGDLGFEKVSEFTSYPRIQIFGHTLIEFPDESAEETWTVFDHPVIRIYKRTESANLRTN